MRPNIARYNFLVMVLLSLVLLASGWSMEASSPSEQTREFLLDLHISLGLTGGMLLLVQIVLRIAFGPWLRLDASSQWLSISERVSRLLIYASFALLAVSGYLRAVASGSPGKFWGFPLPLWEGADQPVAELLGRLWGAPVDIPGAADWTVSELLGALHGAAAVLLAASILSNLGASGLSRVASRKSEAPATKAPQGPSAPAAPPPAAASLAAQKVARTLRLFGWIQFWIQLVFVLVSALLLQFAGSGRAFSPGAAGFGDAIYWGGYAFALLCVSDLIAFYYTRAAKKVGSQPDSYIESANGFRFWFLPAGAFVSIAGALLSFVGLTLSILLLVAKTVSQPPGIAITDPANIIRALDVFILIINFSLLGAHSIGVGVSFWLGAAVMRAHLAAARGARERKQTETQ
jgi:cytochrome b561